MNLNQTLVLISVWALPLLIAITFHEAAHGFAAKLFGDNTAYMLGRVSLNPLKHIDPYGTVLLPGMLLLTHSPFLFGYARPVPVKFSALRHPRLGMACVAAAGPLMNIALAFIAAFGFHLLGYLPSISQQFVALNLKNALIVNAVLAVFNMFPIPPLDGGRIAVAVLPKFLGRPLARLEPFGMLILIALLFLLPLLGSQTGYNLNVASQAISQGTEAVIRAVLHLTGNA
jgi:Zn-dependent protease